MQLLSQVLSVLALVVGSSLCDESSESTKEITKRGVVDTGYGAPALSHYAYPALHGYGAVPVQTVEYFNAIPVYRPIPVAHPIPVPLPVHVPQPVPVKVPVEVPVYHTVKVPVEKPVPYTVEKPYPVEVIQKVPVPVPKPYPVPYTIVKTKHHFREVVEPKWW